MFAKDSNGRLKRIEYRGRYLRVSRTGGVALRAQTRAAGLNLTANSKHGIRVSTRVAKGTQVAFQNGRFVLRGRYGRGPTKLNLSKSGLSVSSKTGLGTINWFKPRYSSIKIAGIQFRGKKAMQLYLLIGLFYALAFLVMAAFQILVISVQVIFWLVIQSGRLVHRLWSGRHRKVIQSEEDRCLNMLTSRTADWLQPALNSIFQELAMGQDWSDLAAKANGIQAELAAWLSASPLPSPLSLEVLCGCLAERYLELAGETACLELFLDLDNAAVADGGRNHLQERLLAVYADSCGIEPAN